MFDENLRSSTEQLSRDIEAAFAGTMTDFDLDGEVDTNFEEMTSGPLESLDIKRAGKIDFPAVSSWGKICKFSCNGLF